MLLTVASSVKQWRLRKSPWKWTQVSILQSSYCYPSGYSDPALAADGEEVVVEQNPSAVHGHVTGNDDRRGFQKFYVMHDEDRSTKVPPSRSADLRFDQIASREAHVFLIG